MLMAQTLRKSRRSGGISKECHSDKRGNLKSRISEETFVVSLVHDNKKDRSEISEPFPRTCNWILEDGRYTTWKDPETRPSMLHVFGNAGCGKSVLAKHILATLDDDSDIQRSRRVEVLYYFCNNRKRNNETASLIVLSMICQLLTRNADLVDDIFLHVPRVITKLHLSIS
ncbi:hypothetical protein OIDMADRAFT_57869 [Oidiodendron maius Zn]|uniref:Nephrocystin 3-like N-terminal domain-containing protein n=1 Tax=Oidiodendron maius (strain Zn) TaxID=913774 RepID=A0A0C3CEA0_OIDMZ|nr:hypothetical protein OIDMADRAFT_57869 [Oidiodendron maius Zn]